MDLVDLVPHLAGPERRTPVPQVVEGGLSHRSHQACSCDQAAHGGPGAVLAWTSSGYMGQLAKAALVVVKTVAHNGLALAAVIRIRARLACPDGEEAVTEVPATMTAVEAGPALS